MFEFALLCPALHHWVAHAAAQKSRKKQIKQGTVNQEGENDNINFYANAEAIRKSSKLIVSTKYLDDLQQHTLINAKETSSTKMELTLREQAGRRDLHGSNTQKQGKRNFLPPSKNGRQEKTCAQSG